MSRPRGRPPRTPAQQPLVDAWQLAPEWAIAGAILKQALVDTHSRRADIRQEAWRFLAEGDGLEWWDEALGLGGVLIEMMQAALGQRGERC